jgi:two-component system chemotaxis response regulator CheY
MNEAVRLLEVCDKNMPILVADDFAGMRKIVKAQLKSLGFENIIEVEDAQQMATCLSRGEAKLLITDSFLPELDLKELFSYVESSRGGSIPILLVSPESQKDKVTPPHKEETRTGVIAKPFTKEILAEKIAGLIGKPKV